MVLAEVLHVVDVEAELVAEAVREEQGVGALSHGGLAVALHQAEVLQAGDQDRAVGRWMSLNLTPGLMALMAVICPERTIS